MTLVFSTINMKGGVGKTTLTVNLATCLVRDHQKRVLIVDLDSQISATLSVLSPQDFGKLRRGRRTLSYLIDKVIRPYIVRKFSTPDMILKSVCDLPGLDLLPGDIELYDEYIVAETLYKRTAEAADSQKFAEVWVQFEEKLMQSILEPIRDQYDYILIDCAPGYNLLTRSAIVASNFYLLPARPEPLSLVGIQLLQQRIAKLKAQYDPTLTANLLGIVFILSGGLFSGRYYSQVMQRIKQDFEPNYLFDTTIPMDVNVAKAVDGFTPAVLSTPNSSGSRAFGKLTGEFLEKLLSVT
ncbi:ParA family protein [Spirulina major CS-329]|uniref:ParA family protein n=1 Tax=Spirulina TaxID=1154 RepID=UPI00232C9448|nr:MULTISPECIES: ParA family protein [Spirulina]MDB9494252.1 ParA family protein [Spirulina subsalsa CS-330]MDB9501833.1 ParA family protein [Spirulina major CS-329]